MPNIDEHDGDWEQAGNDQYDNRLPELDPCEVALDKEFGDSEKAASAKPNDQCRIRAWQDKKNFLRKGDVIFCRARTDLIHLTVSLGQVRNYGDRLNNYFRFWSHAAIVVQKPDPVSRTEGSNGRVDDFMVAQAVSYGVELTTLTNFLKDYQYRCWAFCPRGFKKIDASQAKHAAMEFARDVKDSSKTKGQQQKKFNFGVIALISILLAHIFENLRIQFHLIGQFTCAGLIAELLERGDYVFKEGEIHAFPADVAIKVMPDDSITSEDWKAGYAPRTGSFQGYHDGVNRLFEQLNGRMPFVFLQVVITILVSFAVCGFFVYVGAAVANTVAPDLIGELWRLSIAPPIFAAVSIVVLAFVVSNRSYPITWLFVMSILSAFFSLFIASFDNTFYSAENVDRFINTTLYIWAFPALTLGIATVLFSTYAFVVLTSYLLYPYLYCLGRRVWFLIK